MTKSPGGEGVQLSGFVVHALGAGGADPSEKRIKPAVKNARATCRPHEVVARGQVRHVHPLGLVRRARRRMGRPEELWRMDHVQLQDSREGIRELGRAVQPREVRCQGVGADGQGRRDEIHRDHREAPRRFRDVPFPGRPFQHLRRHALQARPVEGTGRRVPEAGHQAGVLLLAIAGLASTRRGCGPGPLGRCARMATSTSICTKWSCRI